MGELPHFISDVPRETIGKQKLLDEPIRISTTFQGRVDNASTSIDLFTVPEGKILEITSLMWAVIAKQADNSYGLFLTDPTEELITLLLDHLEHQNLAVTYPKLTLLIQSGRTLRLVKSDTAMNSVLQISGTGFLIDKGELVLKTNIII